MIANGQQSFLKKTRSRRCLSGSTNCPIEALSLDPGRYMVEPSSIEPFELFQWHPERCKKKKSIQVVVVVVVSVHVSETVDHWNAIIFQIVSNEHGWKAWFNSDVPEAYSVPDNYETKMDAFHRLLLIRSWCPDRTLSQAKKYVAEALGAEYAQGLLLDMEKMLQESDARTPLVCLLSTGSDPTDQIESLAKRHLTGWHNVVIASIL